VAADAGTSKKKRKADPAPEPVPAAKKEKVSKPAPAPAPEPVIKEKKAKGKAKVEPEPVVEPVVEKKGKGKGKVEPAPVAEPVVEKKAKGKTEVAATPSEPAPAPAPASKKDKKAKATVPPVEVPAPSAAPPSASSQKSMSTRSMTISNGAAAKATAVPATASKSKRAAALKPLPVQKDESEDESDGGEFEPPAAAESEEEDEDDNASGTDPEAIGHLHGFSTDEDSSDDDADMAVDETPGIDVSTLPTIAKDDATIQRRLAAAKKSSLTTPTDAGVIYLGRIPHGFYEDQMRAYFTQFGTVTRLRLSRNKKTGRSKHYGFVEFDSAKVAEIVAETMDNYLLMGRILQCKVVPKDEVHPMLWVGANRKWRVVPRDRIVRVKHNRVGGFFLELRGSVLMRFFLVQKRTTEEIEKAEDRLIQRQEAKRRKLAEAGIDYDFSAVAYVSAYRRVEPRDVNADERL